jgi:hypothetical protein
MKRLHVYWWMLLGLAVIAGLLLHRLAGLTSGVSATELLAAHQPVGWHGIWHNPLNLPLKLIRLLIFALAPDHGQLLTRLPNVLFGGLSMISFGWLIWLWHGRRTALLTTALFASSAWVLHVSRLASFDVLYLWAMTSLLTIQVLLHRYAGQKRVWYLCLITWGLLLYVPGLVWLVALQVWLQRKHITGAWQDALNWTQRALSVGAAIIGLALLLIDFSRSGHFINWLGLPSQWPAVTTLLKQFVGVFVHLFIRGPQYPELWLGRAPLLDVFSLIVCIVGIYFYASHWKSSRSRAIGLFFTMSVILVALGGAVSLSLLVPLLYVAIAAGIAYLLRDWLQIFPINPLARGLGIGLISLAVIVSCLYNLRAYFVAWPYNTITRTTFRHHL